MAIQFLKAAFNLCLVIKTGRSQPTVVGGAREEHSAGSTVVKSREWGQSSETPHRDVDEGPWQRPEEDRSTHGSTQQSQGGESHSLSQAGNTWKHCMLSLVTTSTDIRHLHLQYLVNEHFRLLELHILKLNCLSFCIYPSCPLIFCLHISLHCFVAIHTREVLHDWQEYLLPIM